MSLSPYLVASCGRTVYVCATGLCSMKNAPILDAFLNSVRQGGVGTAYVDLSAVTGMDSTFMGMLVGHAAGFAEGGGSLVIVRPSEKSMQLLTLLGLVEIVRVVPEVACPSATFVELTAGNDLTPVQRLDLVKRAHVALASLNEENRRKFEPFLRELEKDQAKRSTG